MTPHSLSLLLCCQHCYTAIHIRDWLGPKTPNNLSLSTMCLYFTISPTEYDRASVKNVSPIILSLPTIHGGLFDILDLFSL